MKYWHFAEGQGCTLRRGQFDRVGKSTFQNIVSVIYGASTGDIYRKQSKEEMLFHGQHINERTQQSRNTAHVIFAFVNGLNGIGTGLSQRELFGVIRGKIRGVAILDEHTGS